MIRDKQKVINDLVIDLDFTPVRFKKGERQIIAKALVGMGYQRVDDTTEVVISKTEYEELKAKSKE